MIQSTYTSVTNADIIPCGKKGTVIHSEPIPLLKDKYLSEFRTELERAKVRKNLGIADEHSLIWGSIEGKLENQTDLVNYVESKWEYSTDLNENITNIQEALDYVIEFVTNYVENNEAIEDLKKQVQQLQEQLTEQSSNIENINENISTINQEIEKINEAIVNINVDKNIQEWIQSKLEQSRTIRLEGESLEVKISNKEDNSVQVMTDSFPGIYVRNLEPEVTQLISSTSSLSSSVEEIEKSLETIDTYQTELDDSLSSDQAVGGIPQGTTVGFLKGKTISEIVDILIFPTTVRDLIYPQLYYSTIPSIVEVGTPNLNPTLTFIKNDAGEEVSREETFFLNDSPIETIVTYDQVGKYKYKGTVQYSEGEYLVNNKGEITDQRVEAGSINAEISVTSTYPWYAGNIQSTTKQQLIPFNQSSGTITFSLSGQAIIKLPGQNTTISSFKVDGGLGYLNVDLTGWTESIEYISGFPYKVWTKKESYSGILSHQINFTLVQ